MSPARARAYTAHACGPVARLAIAVALLAGAARAAAPAVEFLSPKDARSVMAGKGDPYFAGLQPLEMGAKTGTPIDGDTLEAMRENCRKRYAKGVLEFTPPERTALRAVVKQLRGMLVGRYPGLTVKPWRFIKTAAHIEGGLPHTRADCIALGEPFCAALPMVLQGNAEAAAWMLAIVLHEQVHVYQRADPESFEAYYRETLGFTKAGAIETGPWLARQQLTNPDAPDCPWVLPMEELGETGWWLPLILLDDRPGPRLMPDDMMMSAIALDRKSDDTWTVRSDRDGRPITQPLMGWVAYQERFPLSDAPYHPVEIAAEQIAGFILREAGTAPANQRLGAAEAERLKPLKALLDRLFGPKTP